MNVDLALKNTVEAILFSCGEPIETEKIARVLETDAATIEQICDVLEKEYDADSRGIKLVKLADKYQLCTRPEYFASVRQILELKKNAPLSQAAFEVLAVIAYNQPVTKSVIEQVRGVDCSGVISSLCEKGLIEEKGRLELPGKPLIYGTTDNFLRCFSLENLSMLPPIPEEPHQEDADSNEQQNGSENSESEE